MCNGPLLLGFAGFVLLVGNLGSAYAAEQFQVKLDRPQRVGDVADISVDARAETTGTMTVQGERPKTNSMKFEVHFDGTYRVLSVQEGQVTKAEYVVAHCTCGASPLVAPGSSIVADAPNGKLHLTIDGKDVDYHSKLEGALTTVLGVHDRRDPVTLDDIYGTNKPQGVGDTWGVGSKALCRSLLTQGIVAHEKDVTGKVTLDGVEAQDGVSLRISADIAIAALGGTIGGMRIDHGNSRYKISGVYPADSSQQPTRFANLRQIDITESGRRRDDNRPFTLRWVSKEECQQLYRARPAKAQTGLHSNANSKSGSFEGSGELRRDKTSAAGT